MKIVILANWDIAANYAINLLRPALAHHHIKLLLSDQVGGKQQKPAELQQLAFYEKQLLQDLVFPLLDKSHHRPKQCLSFERLAQALNTNISPISNINSEAQWPRATASGPTKSLRRHKSTMCHRRHPGPTRGRGIPAVTLLPRPPPPRHRRQQTTCQQPPS